MNCLKVLTILCVLFIFCGAVYGAEDADALDTQESSVDEVSAVSDTVTVEGGNVTYDKLVTNNGEEVVIEQDSGESSVADDKTSVPDVVLNETSGTMSHKNPANVFINESFNFQMIFKNLGDTTGFQPYIQFITPEEITQFTATYSGMNIVPIKVGVFDNSTYNNETGLYTLIDPFTKKEVHGPENSTFYILQYPLGSFTIDAPDAVLNITSKIGDLEVGKLINFTVTPVFRYGNSPVDDPVNYPPIYGDTVTGWINPVVVKIDKDSSLSEDETATGSNFPFDYYVDIQIANGAKIENITITDILPTNIMYKGSPVLYNSKGQIIDPSSYEIIEEPTGDKTGGKLVLKLKEAVGDLNKVSLKLKYSVYAPEFDNSGDEKKEIINSETGIQSVASNVANINYTYANSTYETQDVYNVYLKSLATQKHAYIQDKKGESVIPTNVIKYVVNFKISDYFAFDDVIIYDDLDLRAGDTEFGSAQKVLTENKFVLSIKGKTYELNESYYDIFSEDSEVDDDTITFYISKFLKENNIMDSLKGGYYTDRDVNEGIMSGSLTFFTKVVGWYSNTTHVVANDIISNRATTSGTVLNTENKVSDGSSVSLQVPTVALSKNIIAIDGELVDESSYYNVYPGQNVTFLADIYFPIGSVQDFVLTDFLPIPLFSTTGFSLVNSTTGVIPKGGHWAFSDDSGYVYDVETGKIVIPTVSLDSTNNAISFTFGNTMDNEANAVHVKLWFTVTVSSEPMADQLNLVNLAQISFTDSLQKVYASSNIVAMTTNEPEINITKNVNQTKILEDIENATYVKYNITINSIGNSNVYDIVVADDFINVTNANGTIKADITDISLVYSNGTIVNITSHKDELFGNGYKISKLDKNESCSIIYTVRFTEYLVPKESIVNNVWITKFSAFPDSTNFVTNKDKYRDNATIVAKGLEITKEFVGSNVTNNTNVLFVGDVGIYNIIVNFPDLRVPNLIVEDVSYGIKYTNFTITTSDGVVVPEYAYKVTYTPSATHPEGSHLTIEFNGDLVPAYAKNNQLIINAYYTVVNNENVIPTGKEVSTTNNYATIAWTNNTLESNKVYVDVYQPKIDISKVFEPNIVQGNEESTFTITITNNGKATAFNTTITDDLTEFINTFVGSASDISVTVIEGNETGKVTFTWNDNVATINAGEVLAGKSVKVKFTFTVKGDVVIGKEFKNTADVNYYSIFNEEKFDEKRNYSNQASSTIYTYNATVNKTVFNTTIVNGKDKVTIGENITYNITMILPIGKYDPLEIIDTLPEGISYIDGSIVVYYGNNSKASENTDYTVAVDNNIIKITFTQEFINKLVTQTDGKCQVFFNGTVLNIDSNKAGVTRTNKATLNWNEKKSESSASVSIVEPGVEISKKFNVDTIHGGDIVYFDVVITNNGKSPLFNVTLTDDLSDLIKRFSVGDINVTSEGSVVEATWKNGTASINIDELGIGKAVTYRFTFKIKDDVTISSVYNNIANVIGYSALTNGRNYTASAKDDFTTELPTIDKWVIDSSIDNGKYNVAPGEEVYWGINVTMPMGNYTKLTIKDTLPQGFDYVNAVAYYKNGTALVNGKDWNIVSENGVVTITLTNAFAGAFDNNVLFINLTARASTDSTNIKKGFTKTNTAELFLNDVSMGKDDAVVTIVEPGVTISKNFNVEKVIGGDSVYFDVVITNNGNSQLFNVNLTDDLNNLINNFIAGDIVVTCGSETVTPTWKDNVATINIAELASGASKTYRFSFKIRDDVVISSVYENVANVIGSSVPTIYGRDYTASAKDSFTTNLPTINKWVMGSSIDNGKDNVAPGEEVYWGINVTMPMGNYTKLTIKDTLPKGFDYVKAVAYDKNGAALVEGKNWTIENKDGVVTITLNNAFAGDFANGILSINLTARASTDNEYIKKGDVKTNDVELFLNDETMGTSSAKVTIVEPGVTISKNFNVKKVIGGDNVYFDVVITNNGNSPLFNVNLTDDLNNLIKNFIAGEIVVTCDGETVTPTWKDNVATINIAELASGASKTYRFSFKIRDDVVISSVYENVANVIGSSVPTIYGRDYTASAKDSFTTKLPTINKWVMGSSIDNGDGNVAPGEEVYWGINVTMPMGNYTKLTIKDTLPKGFDYVKAVASYENGTALVEGKDWTIENKDGVVTITLNNAFAGDFANGILSINLTARANASDVTVSVGAVKTNNVELFLNDETMSTSSAKVTIVEPGVLITNKFNVTKVVGGDSVYFDVVITNPGNSQLFNVTLTDDLNNLINNFISGDIVVTCDGETVTPTWKDNVATITIKELASKASKTYRFSFKIRDDVVIGSTYNNLAKVVGSSVPTSYGRNYTAAAEDSFTTELPTINKWVMGSSIDNGKDNVAPGEEVYWGINVTMPMGNYTKLTIKDKLPQGFDYVKAVASYENGTALVEGKDWTIENKDGVVTITLNNAFAGDFANGILSINLTARANADDATIKKDTVKTNNVELFLNDKTMGTSSAKVTIVEPGVTITKDFNVTKVIGGDSVYFDVVIKNNGNSPLFNIALSDNLSRLLSNFSVGNINVTCDGAAVTPTWNNGTATINIAELASGASKTYRFAFKVREDVVINSVYENIANVVGYSAPANGREYTASAKDSFTTELPTITKWVMGSSIDNGKDKVTLGEKVYYGINVTLPTGNYTKLVIVDDLPSGINYKGAVAYYANGTQLVNGKDWTISNVNDKITITLNNIHSSDFTGGILSINLTAMAYWLDTTLKDGVVKTNNVELFLNDKTMGKASTDITIVEPTLDVTKKFNVTYVEGSDSVCFDVVIANNGHSPLFNITMGEDLSNLALFLGQTASADNVKLVITDEKGNPVDATVKWNGDDVEITIARLNASSSVDMKFSFVVRKDIQIGSEYVNNIELLHGLSAPENGRWYWNTTSATLKTKMPTFSKTVIGTTLGHRETDMFTVNIGENVTYQFVVYLPKGNYTNLQIKDILPQGLKYLENSAVLKNGTVIKDVKVDGNTVTINFGNTSSYTYDGELVFNLSVAVLNDTSNIDSTIKTNNAQLYLNNTKLGDDSAQVKITEPNISVTKTSDKENYEYYENATYSITITNKGVGPAFNITIKDVLPAGLKYTGVNTSSKSEGWTVKYDEATQTFTITGDTLAYGETFTFTYKVSFVEWEADGVKYSPIGKNFVNPANVVYVSINGVNNRTYTTQTNKQVHVTEADLSVSKTCDNNPVIAGEKIYYTIVIKNNGIDPAQNVVLNEYYYSEYLTNLEFSLDGKTWTSYVNPIGLDTINSGASKTVYVRGDLDPSLADNTVLNNTVRVNTTTGELKLGDNEDINLTNVTTLAELHVVKTNMTDAIAGKKIMYYVTVTNNGPSYARDVVLTDIYNSTELSDMFYSVDGGKTWIRYDGGDINLGVFKDGESRIIEFEALIKSDLRGNVVNTATIASSTKLTENSTLKDDVTVNVKGDTTLTITKTTETELANPGDTVIYYLDIVAGGSSDSLNVTVVDELSDVFFDKSSAIYYIGGEPKGSWTGSVNLGTMKTGSSVRIVISANIRTDVSIESFKPMLNNITNFAKVSNSDKVEDNDTNVVPINIIDLAISKTADHQNKTYNYGDDVEYTIEITNNGPGTATNIIATDELPDGFSFTKVTLPDGWTYSLSENVLTINGNTLAKGEKVSITLVGKVTKSNTDILNSIKVNGTGFDSDFSNNKDSETVKVTPLIDLAISKRVNNENPLYNTTITYTITVVNNGPDKATNVLVKDIWPADGVKFISSTGSYDSTTGIWTVGDLANGQRATLTITGQTIDVGEFENKVSVNGTGYDGDLSNNNASVNITVPESVLLNINKIATGGVILTGDTKNVIAGTEVTYTVTVSNLGPSVATNVYLTDLFDASKLLNMEYNLDGNWVKYENGIELGNIDANKVVTILFRATVNSTARGLIENTVRITTDIGDARGNFSDDETVNAISNAMLNITKTSSAKSINPGDLFNYTIEIAAKGASDSLDVVLTDVLDNTLLDADSANFYVNGEYVGKWTGSYNIGILKTGDKITVTIEVRALTSANKDVFNKATVTNGGGFTNQSNTTVHVNLVDLAVVKSVDNANPKYLDNITYTIVVTNKGQDKSTNVSVRDILPDGVKYISSDGGRYNPETGVWYIGDLINGGSRTLTIIVQVMSVGNITNNVTVSGTGFDVNLTNNNDSVSVNVPDCVILNITKVARSNVVVAGGDVAYRVIVTNNGPSVAKDVKLSDIYNTKDLVNMQYSKDFTNWSDYTGGDISLGDIGVNSSVTIYFRSKVNGSTRGDVLNTAKITTATKDARGNFSDDVTVNVIGETTLKVVKEAEISNLNPGDTVHYIITVTAGGSSDSLNVVLKDVLNDKLLDAASATYAVKGGDKTKWTGNVELGTIATGTSVVVDIWAKILNTTGVDVFNTANVTSTEHPEGNTSNTTVHVNIVDLAVDKSVDNTNPKYLDNITYTIVVTNNGPDTSYNITVRDLLPEGVKFISADDNYDPETGIWFINHLDKDEVDTLRIVVQVMDIGDITNKVNVTGTGFDSDLTNNNDSVVVSVPECVILDITKVAKYDTVVAGGNVDYTVVVTNNGPSIAKDVVLKDTYNAKDLISMQYSLDGNTWSDYTGDISLGDIAVGGKVTIYFKSKVNPSTRGGVLNTVNITTSVKDARGNLSDSETINVIANSTLEVVKTSSADAINPGDLFNYTIVITAKGTSDSLDVVLTDVLDNTLLDVDNAEYYINGVHIGKWSGSCEVGSIEVGGKVVVNIEVRALTSANKDIFNKATAVNKGGFIDDDNTTVHVNLVDLAVDKSVDNANPKYLDNITYTIVVTNKGQDKSANVSVRDLLPEGVKFISADGNYDNNTGVWFIGDLDAKASATLKIIAQVTVIGNITNNVTVNGTGFDVNLTNNNDSVSVSVPDCVILNIVKLARSNVVVAGDIGFYRVTITNNGPCVAKDVVLTDIYNTKDLVDMEYSLDGLSWSKYTGDISLGDIAVNGEVPVYFRSKVNSSTRGDVLNTAKITTATKDARGNFSDDVTVNVIGETTLKVVKEAEISNLNPGDTVHYVITVTAGGLSDSFNVVLKDVLNDKLLDAASATYAVNGGDKAKWTGNVELGTIATGTSVVVDVWVKILNTTGEDVFNIANVTSTEHPEGNTSNTTVHVNIVDLAVYKSVNNVNPKYLDNIAYTIVVTNNGPDTSYNITVRDLLPDGLKFITSTGNYNPETGVWFIDELVNKQTVTLTIIAQVVKVDNITNKVNVTGSGFDSNLTNNNDSVGISVPECVVLNITKVANSTTIIAGGEVIYTVVVTNDGPCVAKDVVLTDTYNNKDLINMRYSFDNQTWYDYAGGVNLGDIAVDGKVTIYFDSRVNSSTRGSVLNTVRITTTTEDARGNLSDSETINVIDNSTLSIVKTSSAKNINPGDLFNYTIVITAEGTSDSLGVVLTDVLDSTLLDAGNANYYVNGKYAGKWTGSYDIGTLKTGDKITVTIEVKSLDSADKDIFNNAVVKNDEGFSAESNTTVHINTVDLVVNKTASKEVYKYLENVVYTIVVTNNGPDTSYNVTVRDLLPRTLSFISSTGDYDARTGIWTVGTLAKGESATLTITALAIFPGNITNGADADGTGYDVNLTNNHDEVTVTIADAVILNINKLAIGGVINTTAGVKNVIAGTEVIYQVNVTNSGPSTATNVVLKDSYHAEDLTITAYSFDNKTWTPYTNNPISLGNISANGKVIVYFKAIINASARGVVQNKVSITTDVKDAKGIFSSEEYVNVLANSTLKVNKTAEISELNPEDTIHYIINVTAGGSSDSLNVVLKDILDADLLDVASATYAVNGVNKGSWTGSAALGTVATGTTVTVDIWAKILNTTSKDVFNLANVTSAEHPEGDASNTTVHVRIVDLAIEKLVNNTNPKYLDNITYTIVVINNGPDKSFNVVVRDLLPEGVKFISADGNYNSETGIWTVGDLGKEEKATLKIIAQVTSVGNITNNANVTGTGFDTDLTNNNDSAAINVPECVILDIIKVANSTTITAGENVGYTVVITNAGPSIAKDIVLNDTYLAKDLIGMQYSLDGKTWNNYTGAIKLGDIGINNEVNVYFRAKVNASTRGSVLNTVNITTSVLDARGNFGDNETVNVVADTTLSIVKIANITRLFPGDIAHYTITITAGGSSDSLNVVLKDLLNDKLLNFSTATYAIDGVNQSSWTGSLDLGNMATGTTKTIDIWVKILDSADRNIVNTANVTSAEHPEGNTSSATIHVTTVDLELKKTVNNTNPKYLDTIEYTINVFNHGPDTSFNSTVRDLLPAGLKFISADGNYNPETGIWYIGKIANQETATLKIIAQVIAVGNITNNASATSSGYDSNKSHNNDSVTINVPDCVVLDIIKVANSTTITAGENVGYTVIISNNGPSVARDVVLSDTYLAKDLIGMQYSLNGKDWSDYTGGVIKVGDIGINNETNVYFRAKVNASTRGSVLNTVNVTTGVEDTRGILKANETINVVANTTLVVVKQATEDVLLPGDTIHYVLTVTAGGPSDSFNVILKDVLNTELLNIRSAVYSVDGGDKTKWTGSVELGNMLTGTTKTVDIWVDILNTTGVDIFNLANVTSDEHPEGNTSNTTVHVINVDLELKKTVNNTAPKYLDNITYTIVVFNHGPDMAYNVYVHDILPDGVRFISSTGDYNPITGIWTIGNLDNQATVTLNITVQVMAVGNITNNANATSTGYDTNVTHNNDSVTITVPDCVILEVNKYSCSDVVIAGENATFNVLVVNNGPSAATDVVLKDIYNTTELIGMQYSLDYGAEWKDYNGTINLGTINPDTKVLIIFRAKVNASTRGSVLNTVNITTSVEDARGNFTDNATVEVIADTTLSVVKEAEIKELNPGDTVHYIITVTAGGSSDSLNVVLKDILNANLTGATYAVNGVNKGSWTGSAALGTVATGTTVTVDIWAKILNTTGSDIFNLANVTSAEHPQGNTSNTTVHIRNVDLAVEKSVNNTTPKYLDNVTYTIVVTNNGPDKSFNVVVRDLLPEGVKFISSTGNYDPITGIWTVGDLDAKASATLNIIAQVTAVGDITNKVNVTGTGFDTNLTNNNDSVAINVAECVILDITKVANSTTIVAGENVGYTVVVTNNGPSSATDVVLKDIFNSKELIGMKYSLDGGNWSTYTGDINLGTINANSNVTVYFKAKVNSAVRGDVLNTVNITTSVLDARGNFTANATIIAVNKTSLVVVKEAEIKELNPGDTVHYIITVTARGPSDSFDVVLNDILDANLVDATYAVDGVEKGSWTGSAKLGDMAVDTTITVDIWAKILNTTGSDIFNLANVTSYEIPKGNTSNTTVHIRNVDLAINETVSNTNPKYLDNVTYTINVTNNGPDKSFNVTVSDLLPDGVKFISTTGRYDPLTGIWNVGNLANGESATLNITVQVVKVDNITNKVNVTGTGFDTNKTNNNDSVTINVAECVILDITKVANSTVIVAGEKVGYTVVVTNNGPSNATDVVLKDIFNSKELINVEYSLDGNKWIKYGENINLGTINANTNLTVYFRANVNGSTRGSVLNTVNITTSVLDARGNFTANETVYIIADTTLAVIKDAEIKALNPGDRAHFIITVVAGGSSDSLNVVLKDILDSKLLDIESATYKVNGGSLNNYTEVISLGNITTGSEVVVDIYATILDTAGSDVFNLANVTSDEHPEGNTSNTTIHVNIADLEITKLVNNTTPNYGDVITYTIIVKNNGPDNSTNIKISEILADNLEFIQAIASKGQYNLTQGVWVVGNLTNNETAELVITVKIVKTGFIQNNVSVDGDAYDPNMTNNKASVNVTVNQTADLSVVKTVNVETATVGDKIVYTITVKNNGPDTALGVYAVDKLSDALKFVSYKANVGVFDSITGIWTIGSLANGSEAILEITCVVLKEGVVANDVFVNGTTVDLNMSNNYDNVSVTVNPAPQPPTPTPTPTPTPVGPDGGKVSPSDISGSTNGSSTGSSAAVDTMAKTGNPIFVLLVVLILGILGLGTSRRKK